MENNEEYLASEGKINAYTCRGCRKTIIIKDLVNGTTPIEHVLRGGLLKREIT